MNLTTIWTWIKDKGIWIVENWILILVICIGLLLLIWFIKKVVDDIRK